MQTRKTNRSTRSDSATAALAAAQAAAEALPQPPIFIKLRKADTPFWDAIVASRARDEWSDADLILAAQLARCQADIEAENVLLQVEGSVARNERGTLVASPRHTVIERLASRQLSIMRSLRMTGSITGDTRDLAKKRKLERDARKARADVSADSLLAD